MRLYLFRAFIWFRRLTSAGGDIVPPQYAASEEGDVTNPTVAVQFNEAVNSATSDYVTGVTIKINAVAATIASGTRQVDQSQVYYVLTPGADANDAITFEFSDALGDIADLVGNQMGDIAAQTVTNNVGTHLRFTDAPDSGHALLTLGL